MRSAHMCVKRARQRQLGFSENERPLRATGYSSGAENLLSLGVFLRNWGSYPDGGRRASKRRLSQLVEQAE